MPYFDYDGDLNIDVDEFLSSCDSSDIDEIIESLVEDGYIKPSQLHSDTPIAPAEAIFEEALDKLHGKWNRLTREEEIIITTIANKF